MRFGKPRDSTVGIAEGQKNIISLSYKSLHSRDGEIHFNDENPRYLSILYLQGELHAVMALLEEKARHRYRSQWLTSSERSCVKNVINVYSEKKKAGRIDFFITRPEILALQLLS